MKRACVIGWPIAHSRSPLIHGYWLKKYGIEGSYTKEAVKPEDLPEFISTLTARGFAGCNVTVPHKETVLRLVAQQDGVVHPHATVIGAANTLWVEGDGRLHATSTDGYGFKTHLQRSAPNLEIKGRPVLMLGAGGAARSIAHALGIAGASDIRICNRSIERAQELRGPGRSVHAWDQRSEQLRDCALLVNTTTLGMVGQPPLEIDLSRMPAGAAVYDIVYVPLETPLLRDARLRGLRTVDGLGMLLHQAAPGFHKWFGVEPEVTMELRALIEADIQGHT
jgi:shikimate dehydrogenase